MTQTNVLGDCVLTFLLTGGGSLRTWERIGTIERELALYKGIANHVEKVNIVSYGGYKDCVYADKIGNLNLLTSYWLHRAEALNCQALWWLNRKELAKTSVVKTNQIGGAEVALWLKRRIGCKLMLRCGFVWSLNYEREFGDGVMTRKIRALECRAFNEADIGIVTTAANRTYVAETHGVDPAKVQVVPNFVDTNLFSPNEFTKSSVDRLIYIGRLAKEKNLDSLIQALGIIKRRRGMAPAIDIVGDGYWREGLHAEARKAEVEVVFHGNISNAQLPWHLRQANAFILPSQYEGHPKALLEAMSCGVACIGTNVNGIRQELQHGHSGYLCEPGAEAIAEAIEDVLSDRDRMARMGKNARNYVLQNYAFEKVLELELKIIADLVSNG